MSETPRLILAPLRGVTIRAFREVFAVPLHEAGFTEAITPFIAANAGYDPLKDSELRGGEESSGLRLTPQFITKDPRALRAALERIKSAGYQTADLNAGCPFPMVRNKGRGSGLLKTPAILRQLLEVGCEVMGEGNFSLKARLGIEKTDELLHLMPLINVFPLRFLTVHARTARQMYEGACDSAAFAAIKKVTKIPLVYNGDATAPHENMPTMIGRGFIRSLSQRTDIGEYLDKYLARSKQDLSGDHAVVGRLKELLAYWQDTPRWRKRWQVAKLAHTTDELRVW